MHGLRAYPNNLIYWRMSKKENQQREREQTPNNRTTTGFLISDELWAGLEPLLPVHINTHRFGGGAPSRL